MEFIPALFICLSIAYILSWAYRKIGLPHILGHLTTGLIISIPAISKYLFQTESSLEVFSSLANLGLIFLLFFIGLKIDLTNLLKFSKRSMNIAFLSAMVPFGTGYLCGIFLGMDFVGSLILGAALSVTAEAVSGAILQELNLMNTKVGLIIIEAGIIDDVFEILMLAAIGTVIQSQPMSSGSGIGGFGNIMADVIVFIALIYIVRFIFIPTTFKLLGKDPSHSELFTASFIIVLLMAAISNFLELGTIIGALIAGVIVKQTLMKEHRKKEEANVVDMVETITFGFLEPIFFIWIAYTADFFGNVSNSPSFLLMVFFITAVATGGKILGSVIGNVLDKGTIREGILIGWGMNARGAVELIAIKMAYDYGLLVSSSLPAIQAEIFAQAIYASVVLMAFITTITSPIIFKLLAKYQFKELQQIS